MGNKLYVGNLPYSATEGTMSDLFSQYGDLVSVHLVTDRDSGRSKGFGFVEFSSSEDAEKAISALDGNDFEGRNLKVNEARPKAPGGGGGRRGGGGGGGRW